MHADTQINVNQDQKQHSSGLQHALQHLPATLQPMSMDACAEVLDLDARRPAPASSSYVLEAVHRGSGAWLDGGSSSTCAAFVRMTCAVRGVCIDTLSGQPLVVSALCFDEARVPPPQTASTLAPA